MTDSPRLIKRWQNTTMPLINALSTEKLDHVAEDWRLWLEGELDFRGNDSHLLEEEFTLEIPERLRNAPVITFDEGWHRFRQYFHWRHPGAPLSWKYRFGEKLGFYVFTKIYQSV